MLTKRDLLRSAALAALSVTATKSAPASAQTSARWPEVFEAKGIAEEGFIYGLPLVMNYAVMQEFAVDTKSGQFKAPFNEIKNEHHVVYPGKDTAVITPNSDTPYSMLWLDLRAEPIVISVPAVEQKSLLRGATHATAIPTTTAISAAAPPGPSQATISWSARTGKGTTPPGSRRFSSPRRTFTLAAYPHPALQSRRHAERREDPGRLQGAAAFLLSETTVTVARSCRKSTFLPATTAGIEEEFLRVSRRSLSSSSR